MFYVCVSVLYLVIRESPIKASTKSSSSSSSDSIIMRKRDGTTKTYTNWAKEIGTSVHGFAVDLQTQPSTLIHTREDRERRGKGEIHERFIVYDTAHIYLNKFSSCVRNYICNSCSLCSNYVAGVHWEIERTRRKGKQRRQKRRKNDSSITSYAYSTL